jgi:hypothetical protein
MVENELVPRFTSPEDYWYGWAAPAAAWPIASTGQEKAFALDSEDQPGATRRTNEYGARIIEAIVTNQWPAPTATSPITV